MSTPRALRQPISLRLFSGGFLAIWCVVAAFPIFWIGVMSFKVPVDAFASNPLSVIYGPETLAAGKGLSIPDIVMGLLIIVLTMWLASKWLPGQVRRYAPWNQSWLGWIIG